MEIQFTPEQEAEFLAFVDAGIADADAGNLVDHEEVWALVQKALKSL